MFGRVIILRKALETKNTKMQVILLKFSQRLINEHVFIQGFIQLYESKARRDFKESPIPSPAPRAQRISGTCPVSRDVAPACFETVLDVEISKAVYPSASVTPS